MATNKKGTAVESRVEKTFLFTDIVASTAAFERVGISEWSGVLERHRRSITALARSHRGEVATFLGDGFMVVFDHAGEAALCALRLQYGFRAQGELGVRIGVESGEVALIGDGLFVGLCVHTAARLCDSCGGGQVLIGGRCVELARADVALPNLELRDVAIRGRAELVRSYLSDAPEAPWLP